MAAQVPTDKVNDEEYSNWLKVTLALYYMKSGLHTFIQSEVDCLHQFLRQKIYGSLAVPLSPCTTCNSHFVRRNKCNGIWTFHKQCKDDCKSYCDVWLSKLLALHKSPKSEKIYWDNSDVAQWPFNPWECAKIFMPRGQPPSNVGPAHCDAQAMLTMLANCTHFHQKLSPQGLGLTHAISVIRNKVMHDGEMKLSDADRLTYIKQIVQLLEDPVCLKLIDDCKAAVGNIHKIDNDSLAVLFNWDIEMTGLRSAVNDFRQELGLQERKSLYTTDTLKEEYEQLRQQLRERFADVENRLHKVEKKVILMQRRNKKVTPGKRKPKKDVLRLVKKARMKRRSDCNNLKQLKKTSQTQSLGSDRLRQVKSARNYTGNELLEAWPSIEEYLLEELSPEYIWTFFNEENILSAEECTTMCQLRRRQALEMLLQSIKVKLPEAFLCLLRALNETGQEKKIEEIQKLLTLAHDQEPKEPAPDMAYYTLKLELLKDGNTVHDTEMKTRGYFNSGRIMLQYDLKSVCLKWEHGSVIVHLQPLKRHTKETLAFFCRHGGMKDFVLDLLKKKDIFASLPEGEMTIHMQVCCYDKESEDGQYGDITQMAGKDVLSPHDGFTVTDDLQLIRKNLLLQYGSVVEEIEPLHFQDTFVAEGIWETDYSEKLKNLKRRRARAADFLNKVMDKGNKALVALVLALRKSGNDYVTDRLCFVPEISAQFMDEGCKSFKCIMYLRMLRCGFSSE
ncbi:hypothetical protein CHS0354_021941 [Potamilus streckersoni]|uniref:CARD domain-containing protein n=1 Tax=Potamilus streckersoni TaxID=2493646 RepID=A0AAE0VX54_9BIVA|nr:hypothetical protein CHS0354_021941 [Potamilus streckersoni]